MMLDVCVAERASGQVSDEEGEKRRILPFDSRQVSVTGGTVLLLDRRKLRESDQHLTDPEDDLLLVRRGELRKAKRLLRYFALARAPYVDFVVRLDRDRWQKRKGDQQKEAG
jgi:hypothetical protein